MSDMLDVCKWVRHHVVLFEHCDIEYLELEESLQSLISTHIAELNRKHKAELAKALANQWISVDDEKPDENTVVRFWLVLKPVDERQHDSSGNPIPQKDYVQEPYMYTCKWKCWSSIMKPTYWMREPEPPNSIEDTES